MKKFINNCKVSLVKNKTTLIETSLVYPLVLFLLLKIPIEFKKILKINITKVSFQDATLFIAMMYLGLCSWIISVTFYALFFTSEKSNFKSNKLKYIPFILSLIFYIAINTQSNFITTFANYFGKNSDSIILGLNILVYFTLSITVTYAFLVVLKSFCRVLITGVKIVLEWLDKLPHIQSTITAAIIGAFATIIAAILSN